MRRLVLLLVLLLAVPASAAARPGFGWPLAGTPIVDRGFAPPTTVYGVGHRGVDLRAEVGMTVLSAGAGRVTYAGLLAGRGVVTVTHDGGLRTTYEPVAASVQVGQLLARGAALGRVTAGHASCRPGTTCLHWGLLRGQTYLNPLELVAPQPIVLLPVGGAVGLAAAHRLESPGVPSRWSGGRTGSAVAAGGALIAGIGLLIRRPPGPSGGGTPPQPIDLRQERRRRRAA